MKSDFERLAESVRAACLAAALEAHEDAGIRGLCPEGRWECAVGAIRALDVAEIAERSTTQSGGGPSS